MIHKLNISGNQKTIIYMMILRAVLKWDRNKNNLRIYHNYLQGNKKISQIMNNNIILYKKNILIKIKIKIQEKIYIKGISLEKAMVRKVNIQIIIIRQVENIQITAVKKVFKVEYFKFLVAFVVIINRISTKVEE
jgi:hypothetical protein